MNALEQKRRSFLFGMGALGIGQVFPQGILLVKPGTRRSPPLCALDG